MQVNLVENIGEKPNIKPVLLLNHEEIRLELISRSHERQAM
ncbi:hypothetical protein [Anabaena catenula]|nr:hypothetical protein [Anabaena catenula]